LLTWPIAGVEADDGDAGEAGWATANGDVASTSSAAMGARVNESGRRIALSYCATLRGDGLGAIGAPLAARA